MLPNLDSFLGGRGPYGYSSVPRPMPRHQPSEVRTYRRAGAGDVMSDVLTGMVLSSVLDTMFDSATTNRQATNYSQQPTPTFRGYRIVEDIVPLGSPVYCIGEIFKSGTDVHMGRSLAKDYPTSFFAARPESEVLTSLDGPDS